MTDLVAAERDLYKRLIELAAHDDLDALLDEALAVVIDLVSATKGAVAVRHTSNITIAFVGCDASEQALIRSELAPDVSRGIVAETIASGKTVATASARVDPRFAGNKSVQTARIEAVVCAPIGVGGALYVAHKKTPGPFDEREVRIVETCAKGLVPFLARLAERSPQNVRATSEDATQEIRARMPAANVVGRSHAIAHVLNLAHVAASSDVAVLLLGETGTGKSAIARAIHDASVASGRASARAFVTIDCASIPATLVESELFGAERGAHSTATKRIPGKLAAAHGGTIFLDEVAELPLESQSKLLGFLQTKRYTPLGTSVPSEIDARVIAATNADLESRVCEKKFREDLYYRLCVLTIRVPPLRERREDVALLADAFTERISRGELALTFGARAAIVNADFPGNVRELEAAIDRGVAFARAEGSGLIDVRHVFPERETQERDLASYQEQMRSHQARVLREALDRAGSAQGAAKLLGLSRSRFYELLRAHDIRVSTGVS